MDSIRHDLSFDSDILVTAGISQNLCAPIFVWWDASDQVSSDPDNLANMLVMEYQLAYRMSHSSCYLNFGL